MPRRSLIRAVPDLGLHRQEEALALARREVARDDGLGVVDEVLGLLAHVAGDDAAVKNRTIGAPSVPSSLTSRRASISA